MIVTKFKFDTQFAGFAFFPYLMSIFKDLHDDVTLVTAQFPLRPRRLVEHEHAPFTLDAV